MILILSLALLFSSLSNQGFAQETEAKKDGHSKVDQCVEYFKFFPRLPVNVDAKVMCEQLQTKEECSSVKGLPIFHYDKVSNKPNPYKILVTSITHGDEPLSGTLAARWIERMKKFEPRSSWRIIPVLNPDGLFLKTRGNANGVDINRNFPTRDWDEAAIKSWKEKQKSDPRRFPGEQAGSEPETRCLISHIEEFKPDLVVSIHTPYGVLDFDGPKIIFPAFRPLKWTALGHFPGSLGRYLWHDRSLPVLTTELKVESLKSDAQEFEELQDLTFNLIRSSQAAISKTKVSIAEGK